jgi:hypothetical protein
MPKRYHGYRGAEHQRIAGGDRGHPAVAPRAGQQRSRTEQVRQVKAPADRNRRDGDGGAKGERHPEPNRRPARDPDRAP